MAGFTFDGIDEIIAQYGRLDILLSIQDEMLRAESEVIIKAQRAGAPKDTGRLAESISGSACKTGRNGARYMDIYPKGLHDKDGKVRNAEVGFINEFGAPKRGIAARQWMKLANEECADDALAAATVIYDRYIAETLKD
jgi:hypothetical protein